MVAPQDEDSNDDDGNDDDNWLNVSVIDKEDTLRLVSLLHRQGLYGQQW